MSEFTIGTKVTAFYKTGKYIGEITGTRPDGYVVRILSVLKHPRQGDLHNPNQTDVPLFHERKALSFREQANIPEKMVKSYDGEVDDYYESLRKSFQDLQQDLSNDTSEFAQKSLEALTGVKREYELMYNINL